ncbi:MAG: Transcriptional regulator, AbrB family [Berkelbacteria bacterium GW2011_GWA1_36_9]|uniref:Transcriptional regulator, AbrB family n=1 Tax=Berkelbacteria bacterium GW2011_GWA1_36_9 TaxID=1618331 RepID=A0A0G0FU98_9BACT|nr:MAG: Transcriptional regulator, AbrB family [Berkelbacteria bacterium GW2011_GWA1_36_9]
MIKTTVSQKYQVVIPKEIREKTAIKEGQEMYVYCVGNSIVMSPSPRSYSEKMLGLGQEIWKNIDPLEYIRQERSSWDKKYAK